MDIDMVGAKSAINTISDIDQDERMEELIPSQDNCSSQQCRQELPAHLPLSTQQTRPSPTLFSLPLEIRQEIIALVIVPQRYLPGWLIDEDDKVSSVFLSDIIADVPAVLDYTRRDPRSQFYRSPNLACCQKLRAEILDQLSSQYLIFRLNVCFRNPNIRDWPQDLLGNLGFSILNPVFAKDPTIDSAVLVEVSIQIRGIGPLVNTDHDLSSEDRWDRIIPTRSLEPIPSRPTASIVVFYNRQSFCNLIVELDMNQSLKTDQVSVDFLKPPIGRVQIDACAMIAQNVGYFRNLRRLSIRPALKVELDCKLAAMAKKPCRRYYGYIDRCQKIACDVKACLGAAKFKDAAALADLGLQLCNRDIMKPRRREDDNLLRENEYSLRFLRGEAYVNLSRAVRDFHSKSKLLWMASTNFYGSMLFFGMSQRERARGHLLLYRCRRRQGVVYYEKGDYHYAWWRFEAAACELALAFRLSKPGEEMYKEIMAEAETELFNIKGEYYDALSTEIELPSGTVWKGDVRTVEWHDDYEEEASGKPPKAARRVTLEWADTESRKPEKDGEYEAWIVEDDQEYGADPSEVPETADALDKAAEPNSRTLVNRRMDGFLAWLRSTKVRMLKLTGLKWLDRRSRDGTGEQH